MSETWDFSSAPEWVCERSISDKRQEVMISAETADNGEVTLFDNAADGYMEKTERWITVDDEWVFDLEDVQ